jgi:hypothetical protein
MLAELQQVFAEHEEDGRVRCEYDAELYFGRLR